MRKHCPALLIIAAVAAACAPLEMNGDGAAFARLTVAPTSARAGDAVELTLTNRSDQQLGYNLCPAVLDRREAGEWRQHPAQLTEACTMELRVLEPGAAGTFRHTLPAALPPGTYRFRVGVEWPLGEGQVGIASIPFEVAGA